MKAMNRICVLIAPVVFGVALCQLAVRPVLAQNGPEQQAKEWLEPLGEMTEEVLRDPNPGAIAATPSTRLTLTSSLDKTTAEAVIGWELKRFQPMPGHFEDRKNIRSRRMEFGLRIKGPIGAEKKSTELASLDGLANATTAGVSVTWVLNAPSQLYEGTPDDAFITSFSDVSKSSDNLREGFELTEGEFDSDALNRRGFKKFLKGIGWPKSTLVLNVRGTIGQETFKYIDLSDFSEHKDQETPYALSLGGALIPIGGYWEAALSYTRERSYKASAKRELCFPIGTTGTLECKTGSFGVPTESDKNLLRVEFRTLFGRGYAISPRVTYDFDDDISGAEVAFYFLQDKETLALNGGLNLGWRSDTNAIMLTLFIGALGDILGRK